MDVTNEVPIRRRAMLTGFGGVVGTTLLAGCLGDIDGSTETRTHGDSGQPFPGSDISFSVLGQSCGSGEDTASITISNGAIQVDGVIVGRDTCDTGGGTVTMDAGTLVLTVYLPEKEPDQTPTQSVAQCLTDIEYTFTAMFPNEGPLGVRVIHESANGDTTVATANQA